MADRWPIGCADAPHVDKALLGVLRIVPAGDGLILHETSYKKHRATSTSTDLDLQNMLGRRGVALEEYDLMDYELHDQLVQVGISALKKKPPQGYNPVTLQQVYAFDCAYWKAMTDKCRNGVHRNAEGRRPIDVLHNEVLDITGVRLMLAPLQNGGNKVKADDSWIGRGDNMLHDLDEEPSDSESPQRGRKRKAAARDRDATSSGSNAGGQRVVSGAASRP